MKVKKGLILDLKTEDAVITLENGEIIRVIYLSKNKVQFLASPKIKITRSKTWKSQ